VAVAASKESVASIFREQDKPCIKIAGADIGRGRMDQNPEQSKRHTEYNVKNTHT
jgi:hypothetical protein